MNTSIARYQVFMEKPQGLGEGSTAEAKTLAYAWSWLDMAFTANAPAQLWWIKDRQATRAAAEMDTDNTWSQRFDGADAFVTHLRERYGWTD